LEGALKLKEISYQHAEGYSAGELKHGPIALVTKKVPTVVLAPNDNLFEKTISNMHEVKARGGSVILISDAICCEDLEKDVSDFIPMPKTEGFIEPLLYAIPMQLLAYHAATMLGRNVDQPRNLAKSVTVE
jgi:glucosamine--fructose-6-phosphate aminotransferase (isomerizing)